MMRSLSSATAGLRTHQTKMDVIGNNIANVNTFGFKSSRVTFADVYYQNLSTASAPGSQTGGTNPTQIGYGSSVATIDVMQGVSNMSSTDRALDVYIAGDGFLVSKDASGSFKYTRLGNLGFDADGNLVDANGNFVQGFPMNADGTPNINADGTLSEDALEGIRVQKDILDKLTDIAISSSGAIIGMLPGDTKLTLSTSTNPDWINSATTSIPADSNYRGDVRLTVSGWADYTKFNAAGALGGVNNVVGEVEMGNMALPAGGYTISVSGGKMKMTIAANGTEPAVVLEGTLDKSGKVVLYRQGSTKDIGLTLTMAPGTTELRDIADKVVQLDLHVQLTTKDKGENTLTLYPNGANAPVKFDAAFMAQPSASFGEITIGFDWTKLTGAMKAFNQKVARAEAEDGSVITLGNLVLAKFRNPSGLQESGTSTFQKTTNSGEATYVLPGLEGTGGLVAGNLEMSNVDLSKEMTDMITTQRGFQANSRIITVSDSMLEELVNLKR